MKTSALTELMHTVLDGEATPDQAKELDRHLAADPVARDEFEELRRLFDGLSQVPQVYPPEGLVASVMAGVSQQRTAGDDFRQPFAPARVIGSDSREDPDSVPGKSDAHLRSNQMSQEKAGSKRKIWIGGAIAAAAVVLAISSGIDFPPGSKDTAGTIVPAQRYRAPQNTADDVKLGAPGSAQSTTIPAAGDAASNAASNNASSAASNNVSNAASNDAVNKASNESANKASNESANKAANQASQPN